MRRLAAALAALLLVPTLAGCGGFATSDDTAGDPSAGPSEEAGAAAPQPLPDVTLQPLRGSDEAVDLGDLRGPVVINLWAQWCGPCRDELPKYEAFHRAHPQVELLGVDWQDTQPDRAKALARSAGLTYPLVTDPDSTIAARGLPQLIMVDAEGEVTYRRPIEIKSTAQLEDLVRKHLGVDL